MKLAVVLVVLVFAGIFCSSEGWWSRRRRSCHTPQTSTVAYVNHWDQRFTYSCPTGQSINHIQSVYSSCKRDRVFMFGCANNNALRRNRICYWTGWVNGYDRLLSYKCHNSGFITGVGSVHHNHYEDRMFKFRCCYNSKYIHYKCIHTNSFINNWRAPINFRTPRGYFLVGATSVHDNGQEDRRWKFDYCSLRRGHNGKRALKKN